MFRICTVCHSVYIRAVVGFLKVVQTQIGQQTVEGISGVPVPVPGGRGVLCGNQTGDRLEPEHRLLKEVETVVFLIFISERKVQANSVGPDQSASRGGAV